eukprot:7389474-Prymnesium_polylepis.1
MTRSREMVVVRGVDLRHARARPPSHVIASCGAQAPAIFGPSLGRQAPSLGPQVEVRSRRPGAE